LDLEKERQTLLERDAEWAAKASEGRDIDAILSYWTDHAMVIPPDLPVVAGQAALREYVDQSLRIPDFRITCSTTDIRFSPDGNLAFLVGTNSVTLDGPDGQPSQIDGRVVTIWRREPDGKWRCCLDIRNGGPVAV
jgi:ketosteroid isomerase-like protein